METKKALCVWFNTIVCDKPEGSCENCKAFCHIESCDGKGVLLAHKASMIQSIMTITKAFKEQMDDMEEKNGTRK